MSNAKKSSHSGQNKMRSLLFKPIHIVALAVLIFVGSAVMFYFRVPLTHSEVTNSDMPFTTEYIEDPTIELGQEQTRMNGVNGTKESTYNVRRTLAGKEVDRTIVKETTIKSPVNKTVAKGKKKYQFMWCSDSYYYYFTNDQFKQPNTGYTHQSNDECAKNGKGHMTNLADSAPPQQTSNNYRPTYTPTYKSPTTCNTRLNTYGGYLDPTATTTCY